MTPMWRHSDCVMSARSRMSPQGLMVTGRDRLVPADGQTVTGWHFAVRFHIHPDVRVSRLEGGGILLKLPGGEGWRFRAGGGVLDVEESVYLGGPDGPPDRAAGRQRQLARMPHRSRLGV